MNCYRCGSGMPVSNMTICAKCRMSDEIASLRAEVERLNKEAGIVAEQFKALELDYLEACHARDGWEAEYGKTEKGYQSAQAEVERLTAANAKLEADAKLWRMVRGMPMNKALHRGLGRWCLEGDAWSATPEEALERAGVRG